MNIEKLEARYPDGFEAFVLTTEVKEIFDGFSKDITNGTMNMQSRVRGC